MQTVEKYDMIEFEVLSDGTEPVLKHCGEFSHCGDTAETVTPEGPADCKKASAFADGRGGYRLRFSPDQTGVWKYSIRTKEQSLCGEFMVTEPGEENHGPVRVSGDHFAYADGTAYIPFGTTCYAWIHQPEELQEQTLETLSGAPFNKIRMCVFPKHMPYNSNDPDCYPFLKKADGTWDVTRPDPVFWDRLDQRIRDLRRLGIEADLILFHPYDRWGFSRLSREESLAYLEYCIVRLGAHRNLWWSLANEYDDLKDKTLEDWDAYGETIARQDGYHHLVSIHQIITPYPKRDWMTHCSIQSGRIDRVTTWKKQYGIPIIIDECGYEGNLPFGWGSLTAPEMVHRFWWAVCRGGFCTHGATFHREDEVLWWAKGGRLYGESAERIAFLKELLYRLPGEWKEAVFDPETLPDADETEDGNETVRQRMKRLIGNASGEYAKQFIEDLSPNMLKGESFTLQYFGHLRPVYTDLILAEGKIYRAEVIDTWEMTGTLAAEGISGRVRLGLPGKVGIALLLTEM